MNRREAWTDFAASLAVRGQSAATIKQKAAYLGLYFSFLESRGIVEMDQATRAAIDEYRAHVAIQRNARTGEPWKSTTVTHMLSVVKQFYRRLVRLGRLMWDPSSHVVGPRKRRALPRNVPREEEMEEILARPDTGTVEGLRARAIMEVLYSTGLRRQELMDLNVYDVDLAAGTLRVNCGKGGKGRVVPMGGAARRFVERYLKTARGLRPAREGQQALFLGRSGARLKRSSLDLMVREFGGACTGRKISCHSFRHAFATHMLRAGANLRLVQQMLGHERISTTQVYTRVQVEDLRRMIHRCHPRGRRRKCWEE